MWNYLLSVALLLCAFRPVLATPPDEGMWLPMFLDRLDYKDMRKKGLRLKPEEIYSINESSLKDAIVMLSGGSCTAEMISPQGLMLTNHHCAYSAIQSHSSVSQDYLTNGFWAANQQEELHNEGMTASFLVRMEDVTQQVLADLPEGASEEERNTHTSQKMGSIAAEANEEGRYEAVVKPFFDGNEFYLFVYETFRDVRLVGAPPESIGKYGGDTDNWMWPRHTGDFAVLRVYTAPDGSPADYASNNVPLRPKHHLPISLDGVKEGDFAMVMGYPGSTNRYMSSYGVEELVSELNPLRIKIRTRRLELMKQDMEADPKVRLMYASKYAQVSNYWKYFQGQIQGIDRLDVIESKEEEEQAFQNWVSLSAERKQIYGDALKMIQEGIASRAPTNAFYQHLNESLFGTEIVPYAYGFMSLRAALRAEEPDPALVEEEVAALKEGAEDYFDDYHAPTDQKITAALLGMFANDMEKAMMPGVFQEVMAGYNGDFDRYVADMFEQSIFSSKDRVMNFLADPSAEALEGDPVFELVFSVLGTYFQQVQPLRQAASTQLDHGQRLYVKGQMEMYPDKDFYPEANSTLRLTYGQILDYFPQDATLYSYYTTAQGILQKEDPDNPEFVVPDRLKTMIEQRTYGRYGQNGRLRVGFISNNDITGGNSGSPVINGRGQLIGIAFDGNWEAMSGDIAFEPDLQRCISVDIRYVLFVIDQFAKAGHLLDEMTIVDRRDPRTDEFEEAMQEKY